MNDIQLKQNIIEKIRHVIRVTAAGVSSDSPQPDLGKIVAESTEILTLIRGIDTNISTHVLRNQRVVDRVEDLYVAHGRGTYVLSKEDIRRLDDLRIECDKKLVACRDKSRELRPGISWRNQWYDAGYQLIQTKLKTIAEQVWHWNAESTPKDYANIEDQYQTALQTMTEIEDSIRVLRASVYLS